MCVTSGVYGIFNISSTSKRSVDEIVFHILENEPMLARDRTLVGQTKLRIPGFRLASGERQGRITRPLQSNQIDLLLPICRLLSSSSMLEIRSVVFLPSLNINSRTLISTNISVCLYCSMAMKDASFHRAHGNGISMQLLLICFWIDSVRENMNRE